MIHACLVVCMQTSDLRPRGVVSAWAVDQGTQVLGPRGKEDNKYFSCGRCVAMVFSLAPVSNARGCSLARLAARGCMYVYTLCRALLCVVDTGRLVEQHNSG